MADDYAGDVTPQQAWTALKEDPKAKLIDVRSAAEWNYVGIPDLADCGKEIGLAEWVSFPSGKHNDDFLDQAAMVQPDPTGTIFFLCRSGVRSMHAATAMTKEGYERCFNILGGFEGDKDEKGHRGMVNGWKVAKLPWKQG